MKNSDKFNTIPGNMVRIQKIVSHPEFKKSMESIRELEKDRIFCRHGMEHLLDVARIAYIENMETGAGYAKDVIYAAGLLHDVGKYLQYTQGVEHHIASERIGRRILTDAGFDGEETEAICEAILAHRKKISAGEKTMKSILYRADKISRACYACEASDQCNWSEEKKTPGVIA